MSMGDSGITSITASLPFSSQDAMEQESFGSILSGRYLRPAIQWMMGQYNVAHVDPQAQFVTEVEQADCWWGAGVYLEAFLDALSVDSVFDSYQRKLLIGQCIQLANALLNHQDANNSWDNNVWDTSVICQALVRFEIVTHHHKISFAGEDEISQKIRKQTQSALDWLVEQATYWDYMRYPFGPEDLAAIVSFACHAQRRGLYRVTKAHQIHMSKNRLTQDSITRIESIDDLINYLVERLLNIQSSVDNAKDDARFVTWGPPWSDSHVLLALCESVEFLNTSRRARTMKSIAGGIANIESVQVEGRWGLPNETSLTLMAYLRASALIHDSENDASIPFRVMPELVFKSLRWLTDEKQRFSDGSILHVFTHTMYFAILLAYIAIHYADQGMFGLSTLQLYDYVVWESQIRPSRERVERLLLSEKLLYLGSRLRSYLRVYNIMLNVARLIAALSGVALLIEAALAFHWIRLTPSPFVVSDVQSLLAALGILITVISGFWMYSRRWLRTLEA